MTQAAADASTRAVAAVSSAASARTPVTQSFPPSAVWPLQLDLPVEGGRRLQVALVGPSRAPLDVADACLFAIGDADSGSAHALVSLAASDAVLVAGAILGRSATVVQRSPSRGETGVVLALVSTVLARLRTVGRVQPAGPEQIQAAQDWVAIAVRLHVQDAAASGATDVTTTSILAHVRVPRDRWADSGLDPERRASARWSTSVEWARVSLSRDQVCDLQPGDVVVFSGWSAANAEESVNLRVAGSRMAARLTPAGDLVLADGFMPIPTDASDTGAGVSDLQIIAEMPPLYLCGQDIADLAAGATLALGDRRSQPLTLTVAGQPVAHGTRIDLDGELAVQIDAMF